MLDLYFVQISLCKNNYLFLCISDFKQVEWGRGSPNMEGWCVLSSCSYSYVSDCLVVHAKAKILAATKDSTATMMSELAAAVRLLDRAQIYARALQDYARLKNIAYFQVNHCL